MLPYLHIIINSSLIVAKNFMEISKLKLRYRRSKINFVFKHNNVYLLTTSLWKLENGKFLPHAEIIVFEKCKAIFFLEMF